MTYTLLNEFHFEELSELLNYKFKNSQLLVQAFRHSSYANEHGENSLTNNERLEFLGDAALDLAISDILMERFPNAREGDLSKYRAILVDEVGLYAVALELNLGNYLLLGKGEEKTGGREKPSILANTVEALIGAIYLDAGFDVTKEIISRLFAHYIDQLETEQITHDFKSILQEYTQHIFKTLPKYKLIKEIGPPHDKIFRMSLIIKDVTLAEAEGKSKKEAEQNVAREALLCLQNNQDIL